MGTRSNRAAGLAAVAVLAFAGSAMAQYGPEVFRIDATTMVNGTAVHSSLSFTSADGGVWDDYAHYHWNLQGNPRVVTDGAGHTLFTLNSASIAVDADPAVTANFNVTAGSLNTTFSVASSLLSVPVDVYTGQASAQLNVTDGDGDGATLSVINGAGLYRAKYNGATVFANLFPASIVAPPFGGNSGNASIGPTAIVGSISDISAEFNFSLTANDTATGTSVFTIVPSPGSLALLGLGGLAAARRRRTM